MFEGATSEQALAILAAARQVRLVHDPMDFTRDRSEFDTGASWLLRDYQGIAD